jgi:predicted nucleotidyltransferase
VSQSSEPTPYDDINRLLFELLQDVQTILGARLAGLYLYGSLVWGDFDPDISDVDLLAVMTEDIRQQDFERLDRMHQELVRRFGRLDGRIEIAYMSLAALRTFKTQRSPIAIISPGEPFHIKDAGHDWLINWYLIRERGRIIFGPDPRTIIAPITKAEFIQAVKQQALDWRDWVRQIGTTRTSQGYTILTMCRALCAYRTGEQVSKKKAALWAMREMPDRADQIRNALMWREHYRENNVEDQAAYRETVEFVERVIESMAE